MKISSGNNSQNNINFGLYNRNLINSNKLIAYWKKRGFSEEIIQKSMLKLDTFKKNNPEKFPVIDFFLSFFAKDKAVLSDGIKFPAIDFGDIKTDKITRCSYMEFAKGSDVVRENIEIPSILYSFAKSNIKMPLNKVFQTPLEKPIYSNSSITLEPKSPMKIVKEIIKNYKIFEKSSTAPNDFLAPSQSRMINNMRISLD